MAVLFGIALVVGIWFAIFSGVWWLWCWALPQLWPTGPENLINPGFWLFVVCALLLRWIGSLIFGSKEK